MHRVRFSTVIAAVLAVFFSSYLLARDWSSYSSENFTIYTDEREGAAIALLQEFESFRNVAFLSIRLEPQPSNSKLKILLFRSQNEYAKVGPENTIGYFTTTSTGPRMVMSRNRNSNQSRESVLYHEYIHYVMQEHVRYTYPRWYGEGIAEFYGITTIDRGVATVGAIAGARSYTLFNRTPLRVRDLLDPEFSYENEDWVSRFYAYSWLLMHYLELSSINENNHFGEQLRQFLLRYNDGDEPIAAFEDSFEMTPEEMDVELQSYLRRNRFTEIRIPVPEYEGEIVKRELTEGEKNFLLAENAWLSGKEDVALRYVRDMNSDSSDFAPSFALAAMMENHREDSELAMSYAATAVQLDAENEYVHTYLTHLYSDTYESMLKEGDVDQKSLDKSVAHGQRAIELAPFSLTAHDELSRAWRNADENVKALEVMMSAYRLEPASIQTNLNVGQLLVQLNRIDLARPFLERVYNWTHSSEVREQIRTILSNDQNQE